MESSLIDILKQYWGSEEIAVNTVIIMNLLSALTLGLMVGYERTYHGRAAGMRTYGIVCMASCALTVFAGYPEAWYAGHNSHIASIDPTRAVQGIVTGVGFIGAGVIMRDGMSISGLTTAASIWAASAIGVLVGIGFYGSALTLSLLSASLMMWGSKLEALLPARPAIAVMLRFKTGFERPSEQVLMSGARERGYQIAQGSFSVQYEHGHLQWQFVAVAIDKKKCARITDLADELSRFEGVDKLHIMHARN